MSTPKTLTLQRLVDVTLGGDFAIVKHNGPAPSPPPPHTCPVIPPSVLFFDDFRGMVVDDSLLNRLPVKSPGDTLWNCSESVAVANADKDIEYRTNDGSHIRLFPDSADMVGAACFEMKFRCVAPIGVSSFGWNFVTDANSQAFSVNIFSPQDEAHPNRLTVSEFYTYTDDTEKTVSNTFDTLGASWITYRMEFPESGPPRYVINGTPFTWSITPSGPMDLAAVMQMFFLYNSTGPTTGPIVIDYVGVSTDVDEDFVALLCKEGP